MPADIVSAVAGKVAFDWMDLDAEDLLTAGLYYAEWQVTFSDETVVTFPNDGYFLIHIVAELS